ncbi:MAG: ClpXP protease specificity-enhancing factor [Neisseriaceae bacterium]|nr:ClpXP protease specificity-enhancing factor [Neisseriaceae bacterium]
MKNKLKPYFIRAVYEWCCDEQFTPHIVSYVDEYVRVPKEFVRDNEIVLNIGVNAVQHLSISNEEITFSARFGGKPFDIAIPIGHIIGIFARENGNGMGFEVELIEAQPQTENTASEETQSAGNFSGSLKVIKKK